jgi:hypothetical protein
LKGIGIVVLLLAGGLAVAMYWFTRPPERGLAAGDLAWVGKYVEWIDDAYGSLSDAYYGVPGATAAEADRYLARLRSCSASYERAVGDAPGKLEAVSSAAREACAQAAGAADEVDRSGGAAMQQSLRDSYLSFERAERRLRERLLILSPLPTIIGRSSESHVEPRLSEIATRISAIPMEVRCWSRADWQEVEREVVALNPDLEHELLAGAAYVWGGEPNLAPDVCAPLIRLADTGRVPGDAAATVSGLHVLAHEIAHASGIDDERRADCHGLQLVRGIARAFEASGATADGLAASAWQQYREERSPTYWSPGCRDGGRLDEHSAGPWP